MAAGNHALPLAVSPPPPAAPLTVGLCNDFDCSPLSILSGPSFTVSSLCWIIGITANQPFVALFTPSVAAVSPSNIKNTPLISQGHPPPTF